ncbi:MAG: class I SAM-dependent methyltransferase, partial [Thermoleophilia bacterium]|nr:class I SAM-dependent methyltransferase [Thermoleophilia bacterium]
CFDAIVLRGTLQHLDRPMFILWQAHRMLKPDGVLAVLATPNTGSLCFRLFQRVPALDPVRNFIPMSAQGLMNALENCGFTTRRVVYPYWGTPYARPFSDAMRFAMALLGLYRPFSWPGNMMEVWSTK